MDYECVWATPESAAGFHTPWVRCPCQKHLATSRMDGTSVGWMESMSHSQDGEDEDGVGAEDDTPFKCNGRRSSESQPQGQHASMCDPSWAMAKAPGLRRAEARMASCVRGVATIGSRWLRGMIIKEAPYP